MILRHYKITFARLVIEIIYIFSMASQSHIDNILQIMSFIT